MVLVLKPLWDGRKDLHGKTISLSNTIVSLKGKNQRFGIEVSISFYNSIVYFKIYPFSNVRYIALLILRIILRQTFQLPADFFVQCPKLKTSSTSSRLSIFEGYCWKLTTSTMSLLLQRLFQPPSTPFVVCVCVCVCVCVGGRSVSPLTLIRL